MCSCPCHELRRCAVLRCGARSNILSLCDLYVFPSSHFSFIFGVPPSSPTTTGLFNFLPLPLFYFRDLMFYDFFFLRQSFLLAERPERCGSPCLPIKKSTASSKKPQKTCNRTKAENSRPSRKFRKLCSLGAIINSEFSQYNDMILCKGGTFP